MDERDVDLPSALARVNRHLSRIDSLVVDSLWGPSPHFATAKFGSRVVSARGETPAKALNNLGRKLDRLFPG